MSKEMQAEPKWLKLVTPLINFDMSFFMLCIFREFTTNVGPVTSEAAKRRGVPASVIVREVMSMSSEGAAGAEEGATGGAEGGAKSGSDAQSEAEMKRSAILQKFSPNTIKAILELLCDESVRFVDMSLLFIL